jgi:hypothetical protein
MRFASLCLFASITAVSAFAADDRFWKDAPAKMTGLVEVDNPAYAKECSACHFAYSPGMLPKRSWKLLMERLDKHFGETLKLAPATRDTIAGYLDENAADVSPYQGSKALMARVPAERTPQRFMEIPLFHTRHTAVLEVISVKPRVKVRNLTNCNACHQGAQQGDFSERLLIVPGLTVTN